MNGVTQLLSNPGFDVAEAPGGAVGWTEVTVPITYPSDQLGLGAQSPDRAAWLGDTTRPDQRLSQGVTVPEATVSLSLTIYTCFTTEQTGTEPVDFATISLLDSAGSVLQEFDSFTNLNAGATCGWSKRTYVADAPHAGEQVRLEIAGQNDGIPLTLTSFFFDTLALEAHGSCPDGG